MITARKQDALDEAVRQLGGAEHALGVAGRADDLGHQEETVARAIAAVDARARSGGRAEVSALVVMLTLGCCWDAGGGVGRAGAAPVGGGAAC